MTLPTSPSLNPARAELAQWIESARTAWNASSPAWQLPATESENRNIVDLGSAAAQRPFLSWEIEFGGGGQASLGRAPLGRQYGQLRLAAKVKQGSGAAECLALLDFVIPYVHFKDGTIVRTQVATVVPLAPAAGWYGKVALVMFWIDHIVTPKP